MIGTIPCFGADVVALMITSLSCRSLTQLILFRQRRAQRKYSNESHKCCTRNRNRRGGKCCVILYEMTSLSLYSPLNNRSLVAVKFSHPDGQRCFYRHCHYPLPRGRASNP